MTMRRFDDLSRSVFTGSSRRVEIAGLAAGLVATLPPALGVERADAKKGKKKKKTFRFVASPMTGAQEAAPTVGDPNGSGNAQFTIKGNTVCGAFQFSTTTAFTVTGMHIHQGLPGQNGPIVVNFESTALNTQTCVTCPSDECAAGINGQIKANPAGFYANIHTATNPDGAVRAQLQRV